MPKAFCACAVRARVTWVCTWHVRYERAAGQALGRRGTALLTLSTAGYALPNAEWGGEMYCNQIAVVVRGVLRSTVDDRVPRGCSRVASSSDRT